MSTNDDDDAKVMDWLVHGKKMIDDLANANKFGAH